MESEVDAEERNNDMDIDIPSTDEIDSDGNDNDGNEASNKAGKRGSATKSSQPKKNACRADVLTFCKETDETPFKFQCLICV